MRYKLAIFDLDGTVLNTLGDLAGAVNAALEMHSYPTHSVEEIRKMVGNGVAKLIARAVPEGTDDATCERVLADFKAYYRQHVNDTTMPYAGITQLLSSLRAAGIYVGINSNKFDVALQSLCRIHFDGLFDYAVGESETTPKKPDPCAALRIMQKLGCTREETIYIGDSDVDIKTAANAGVDSAWVSWGFRRRDEMGESAAKFAFDTAEELADFLLS